MTIDETWQNAFTSDIDNLAIGRNSDCASTTDCMKPACPYHDRRILDRRPSGAVDQPSPLKHEYFICHVSFLLGANQRIGQDRLLRPILRSGGVKSFLSSFLQDIDKHAIRIR
jgi:hypothetical protein